MNLNVITSQGKDFTGFFLQKDLSYFRNFARNLSENTGEFDIFCQADVDLESLFKYMSDFDYPVDLDSIQSAISLTSTAIQFFRSGSRLTNCVFISNFDEKTRIYVAKTFIHHFCSMLEANTLNGQILPDVISGYKKQLEDYYKNHWTILHCMTPVGFDSNLLFRKAWELAQKRTIETCNQVIGFFISTLARFSQDVFVRFPPVILTLGLDRSEEGRIIISSFLSVYENLTQGKNTPSIFFQVKEGINKEKGDPNFDLFEKANKIYERSSSCLI